ncbi:hypothetical protein [Anaeroselena agilis]|uniref:Phage protein n=1 Tax=Anaeroselena agilis TaxID=3063788 RepID=A0ABU3NUW6_9FIRM|nr:hypothetical protein [Selenomonadales bacterium 4137-cl]
MTLKQLKALKAAAEELHHGSIEYARAMFTYHSEAAEYWEGRYGSVYNDDEKCTANWNKHNKAAGKLMAEIKRREAKTLIPIGIGHVVRALQLAAFGHAEIMAMREAMITGDFSKIDFGEDCFYKKEDAANG